MCFVTLPAWAAIALVAALAVWVATRDSPLFRQIRVGQDEREFVLYKIRTMRVDAPQLPSHEAGDSSVTRVGVAMRRLKLDELPQLLNVLRGEMHLVGPRPCLPTQEELVSLRRSLGVFAVRPGITGAAQLRQLDMSTPVELAHCEREYLESRSLGADIKVLLATLAGGGRGDGAVDAR